MTDTTHGGIGSELAGRYVLLELLGAGGMGSVYKAKQKDLGSIVAIKLMNPSASTALSRAVEEARLLGSLQHPGIPKVHCVEPLADGGFFVVMDFIEGRSLDLELEARPDRRLPATEAIAIFMQLADALGYAHQNGIVHRDLKPGNIMLSGEAPQWIAHIVDFGIAKRVDGGQKLTQTGAIVGTARYLSPEQASGGTVDARSDVYSLACALYETLSGEPVFGGESAVEVIMRHVQDTVPDLQAAGEYAGVLAKALQKAPADRFQSMTEFAAALRAPSAVPIVRAASNRKRSRKAGKLITATAAVAVIGLAATFVCTNYFHPNQEKSSVQDLPPHVVAQRLGDAVKNNAFSKDPEINELIDFAQSPLCALTDHERSYALTNAGILKYNQNDQAAAIRLWTGSIEASRRAHASPHAVQHLVNLKIAHLEIPAAKALWKTTLEEDEKAGISGSMDSLRNRILYAKLLFNNGDGPGALRQYQEVVDRSPDFDMKAMAQLGRCDVLFAMRKLPEAVSGAKDYLEHNQDAAHFAWYEPHAVLVLANCSYDITEKERLYKKAIALCDKRIELSSPPNSTRMATEFKAFAQLGLSACSLVKKDKLMAIAYAKEALESIKVVGDVQQILNFTHYLRKIDK